jgi:hypothetical protein
MLMRIVAPLLLCATLAIGQDQQSASPSEQTSPDVPIGIYGELPTTIGLEADGSCWMSHRDEHDQWSVEIGQWKWNVEQKEFRLTGTMGQLALDIRRLRVDHWNEDRLVWIPDINQAFLRGAIEYVGFRRRSEQ